MGAVGAATAGVKNFSGAQAVESLFAAGVDFVCIATPDDRHFEAARHGPRGRNLRADRKAVRADASGNSTNCRRSPAASRCWPRSSITSCSIPITRSSARSSPTASCGTSTTVTARSWSRSKSPAAQFAEWIRGRNPGDVRRRPLHQADRFHVPGRLKTVTAHGTARTRRAEGRHDLGQLPAAAGLRIRVGPRGGLRHSHRRGSRPTTSPATSSRKCSSASTTASGTAIRASAASSARSRGRRRSRSRRR